MRRPNADHLSESWRVHEIATDFELLDVWRYPILATRDVPFSAFLTFMAETQAELASDGGPAAWLFALRGAMGRVFGWDDAEKRTQKPTSGAAADSVRSRLPAHELSSEATSESAAEPAPGAGFELVYRTTEESLSEIRNATVHALMHFGRVEVGDEAGTWSPQMAVYVKPRGRLGRVYMTLIGPFRHLIVYPAMMRAAERRWPRYAEARSWEESAAIGR